MRGINPTPVRAWLFAVMESPIRRMFEDKYPMILRNQHTHDFPIYRVTLTLVQATTVVMQYGSHADLKAYVHRQTPETHRLDILMTCLAASMGKPLFLTLPVSITTPHAMRSAVLLALDNHTNDPLLVALCHVISTPHVQGDDFVLRHACMAASDYGSVAQVSVLFLMQQAVTLADSLRVEATQDAYYALGPDARAALANSIPCLMDWYYPAAELKDHHVRVYTACTTYAGHVARQVLGPSLVHAFLLALAAPDLAPGLRASRLSQLVEPLRGMLLARLIADARMSTSSAFYLFSAVERGSWVDAVGEVIERLTSYPAFCAAMRTRELVGAP